MESAQDRTSSIKDKAVVVTGGTTGIGRAIAEQLAEMGARLLIFGRHEEELEDALDALRQAGGEAYGLRADVSQSQDVRRAFEEADARLGRLDVLINNAGVGSGPLEEEPLQNIEYVLRTNLEGFVGCARIAADRMKKQGSGHIVNIGSMSAGVREEENSVYVATKSAIQGFSESLRKSVNAKGIKVTLIEPGKVATDIFDMPDAKKEAQVEAMKMLRPEDVASCVRFCLMQPRRCDVVSMQVRPHRQEI